MEMGAGDINQSRTFFISQPYYLLHLFLSFFFSSSPSSSIVDCIHPLLVIPPSHDIISFLDLFPLSSLLYLTITTTTTYFLLCGQPTTARDGKCPARTGRISIPFFSTEYIHYFSSPREERIRKHKRSLHHHPSPTTSTYYDRHHNNSTDLKLAILIPSLRCPP